MLPDRKRMLKIGIIGVVFFVLVILGIYYLTKYIKSDKTVLFVSDPYPSEYVYIGIQHSNDNGYEQIAVLNSDFTKSEQTVNSFFKIQDLKVIDNKLVIYSDAINEIAYKKEDDTIFLNEINSFYNTSVDVRLAHDYIVYATANNEIFYRKYTAKEEESSLMLANNLTSKNMWIVKNTVYYRDFEGIVAFDLDTAASTLLVPADDGFSPYVEGGNDNYILIRNNQEYFLYGITNGESTYVAKSVEESDYKFLTLYEKGFIYARLNPYALIGYSVFYNRKESAPYTFKEDLIIENIDCFDKAICYLDFINPANEHTYMIFDFETNTILATLDEAYERIIKVQ